MFYSSYFYPHFRYLRKFTTRDRYVGTYITQLCKYYFQAFQTISIETLSQSANHATQILINKLLSPSPPRICFYICGPGKSSISSFLMYFANTVFSGSEPIFERNLSTCFAIDKMCGKFLLHPYTIRLVFTLIFPTMP